MKAIDKLLEKRFLKELAHHVGILNLNVISADSNFRLFRDFFVLLLIFLNAAMIPYQIAFVHVPLRLDTSILYIIDVFFIIDICLNFFTSYRYQGIEVTDPKQTATHYLKTYFVLDMIATAPFAIIFLGRQDFLIFGVSSVLLFRVLRLLRVVHLFVIFHRWEELTWTNSGFLRITKFFFVVLLLIHWLACGWFWLAFAEDFPEDSWVVLEEIVDADRGTQYIRSLYWSITTMTTVGYGDITPNRNVEYLFASLAMLLGASLYAYIIGNIASLVSNLDSAKASFSSRVEAVTQYLHYRHVPQDLNGRVRDYYEYLWARHRGLKEDAFFDDLPQPLRLDVLLHLTRDLLEKVPLFKFCSPSLRNVLLMTLKTQTYSPDGHIVREGEVGKEIYFISRGQAEITSDEGKNNYGMLEGGDYFGDLSLILGEQRTASVKALTYCEVFILTGDDFNRIKNEYPEFKEVLKKTSSEKTEKVMYLVMEGVVL
ncbi:MAG: hypothetical protein ACI8XV_002173 [Arenicella sp.]|jgi:hypothetical protein